jgi:altronate dehydratase large subunit
MDLTGYVRPDGRVGFRNYLLVLPLVGCVVEIARRIAENIEGAVPAVHPHGCELIDSDSEWFGLQMERLATHPNVGGVIFITLSCGETNRFKIPQKTAEAGKLIKVINYHHTGGTHKSIEAGIQAGKKMMKKLAGQERESVGMEAIILGTKCGSSDKTSLEVLHPITGIVCDRIVDEGGTVVLAENYELWADIETLASRAMDKQVNRDTLKIKNDLNALLKLRYGRSLKEEKRDQKGSFQHASKAGTKSIQNVIPLEGRIEGPGLIIHDGPNNDLISVTTQAVAGCNLLMFTTGRGTPLGGVCIPVVKVTANSRTQELMSENIDVGVSEITEKNISPEAGAEKIYQTLLAVANGKLTKAETLGHFELQFHIKGVMF